MREISSISHRRLQLELETLEVRLREAQGKVESARELGDLSENDEYSSALNLVTTLNSRKIDIEYILSNCTIKSMDTRNISVGTLIEVKVIAPESAKVDLGILMFDSIGSAVFDGTISADSPLGRAIQGGSSGEYKAKGPTGVDFTYRVDIKDESRVGEYLEMYPANRELKVQEIFNG